MKNKMQKIKIFLALAVVAMTSALYFYSDKPAQANDLCSGIDLDLELYNTSTGQVIGNYTDIGSDPMDGGYEIQIPYGAVVRYTMTTSGTPSFTMGRYYVSGAYTHSEHTYSPNPNPGMSNIWTAPAIYDNAIFSGSVFENVCTDNPPHYGDESSSIFLSITVDGGPLYDSATTELAIYDTPDVSLTINGGSSATIQSGQTATLAWTPTATQSGTACTATSNPTNSSWNGTKSSTPGTTYTQSTGINTSGTYSIQCTGYGGATTTVKTVTLTVNPNVPQASITCNGLNDTCTIPYDSSATIAWSSQDATSCTVAPSNWTGTSGSQTTGNLTANTTYSLSCTGPGGTANDSVQVIVGPNADIKCNDADSCNIDYNSSALISWTSVNATSCTVTSSPAPSVSWSGTSGGPNTTGPLTTTTTYTMDCSGPGGSDSDSVVVTVGNDFAISCTPATRTITVGDSTSFAISTSAYGGFNSAVTVSSSVLPDNGANGPSISFSGNNQVPPATTTAIISTTGSTTPALYTITFTATGGGKSHQCQVTLDIDGFDAPIVTLYANGDRPSTTVAYNGTANLTWTSTNATSCTASGDWSGSKALNNYPTPGEDQSSLTNTQYIYTLTCTGPGGSDNDTVIVNVNPNPDFTLVCTPASRTITVGGSTSYSLSTTAMNGFNSQVQFSVYSMDPDVGNPPSISFTNNNQVPPATTTALVLTNASTQTGTYTIVFSGTGGGKTQQCSVELIVDPIASATANITANGQGGSITVDEGSEVVIDWWSENTTDCIVTPIDQTGTSGTYTEKSLMSTTEYVVTCTGGDATDNVTVNVVPPGTPDFDLECTPATQSIAVGDTAVFSLRTTPVNGFSSQVQFSVGSIDPDIANGPSVSFTNNNQVPPATTSALVSTNGSTAPGTYTIVFSGTGGGKTHSCPGGVELTINGNTPPTAWITADGSSSDITISSGSSATIDWGSTNANSCTVSPAGWTGISGSQSTGSLSSTTTYTVDCSGPGGSASDSITVNVTGSPEPPASMSIDVSACQAALITWSAPSSGPAPTGYRIYRSTDGSSWGTHINTTDPLPTSPRTYTDTPSTGNYYYAVTAMNGASESAKKSGGPVYVRPCTPNLSTSDKDIIAVSPVGMSSSSQACSGEHEPVTLNGNKSFKVGDLVTFKINVCNSGDSPVTGVVVRDTLTNLSDVSGISYSGCSAGSHSLVSGGVDFTVGDVSAGGTCSITFTAKVTKPGTTSSFYRFQNRAIIDSTNLADKMVSTPLYQFTDTSGNPDRNEIAP